MALRIRDRLAEFSLNSSNAIFRQLYCSALDFQGKASIAVVGLADERRRLTLPAARASLSARADVLVDETEWRAK